MDWKSWEFQSIKLTATQIDIGWQTLLCKIRICFSPSLLRINYGSDKAIPACRLLVCKIDKNESVLFRYKVIYMKKGEKKPLSIFATWSTDHSFRYSSPMAHCLLCFFFHDLWCRYRINSFRTWKSTNLADHFFFSCLWSENDIVQLLTLGQQCQVLSFLLLSICNWHLFLLDCNEFLVETPKWNPHHWHLQARTWQLEDGSSRWTYRYQWKEKDKIKLYICCLLSFYCVTVCILHILFAYVWSFCCTDWAEVSPWSLTQLLVFCSCIQATHGYVKERGGGIYHETARERERERENFGNRETGIDRVWNHSCN